MLRNSALLLGSLLLILAFNNCGEGFVTNQLEMRGSSGLPSFSGELCEDDLVKTYSVTYHPFVTQNCSSCHVSGPGIGTFASPDLIKSFSSFSNIGAEKINSQATNPNHKPPFTGTQHEVQIAQITAAWASVQESYAACVARNSGGSVPPPVGASVVRSMALKVPANLATNFMRMEWDLETQSNRAVPLILGIEIRRAVIGGITRGYEFRSPTLRLKRADAGAHQARALNFYINGALQGGITTFSDIDLKISSTTNVSLAPATTIAIAAYEPATTDTISLEFSSLVSEKPTSPPPSEPTTPTTPPPTPPATPPATITYTQLVATQGVFAKNCLSCHNSGYASGGLDMSTYQKAKAAAASIKSRSNNSSRPMPTGGLLDAAQREMINAWVDAGAPQ